MSGMLGNVNLSLGLNTGPATLALQQYYAKLNASTRKATAAQAPLDSKLNKVVTTAKKLGFAYDKASKTFKNGFGKTKSLDEMRKKVDRLNASLDRLDDVAGEAAKGIKGGFASALQSIPQGIGIGIGQQLLSTFTQLPKMAAGAAAGSVSAFADIDRSLRQTLSIAGEAPERFDELTSFMNDLAAQTKFTAQELAEASVQLARAGFSADEMKAALPGVAQGAAAAGESIESMADTVIASLGGFGLAADEAGMAVDVLTQAANNSNTSVSEMGEGLKYVGPIAKSLGISLEDTAALAGLLANNGIKASQMGTTLRGGLGRLAAAAAGTNSEFAELSRGTGRMSKVLQMIGADIKDANGNLIAMPQLIGKLRNGFNQLQGTERQLAAKILFGEEAGSGWVSLLNNSAAEVETFFQKTNNASGVAAETAQQNLAGISGSLDLLNSAIGSVQAAFGKFFSAGLKPVVDGLTGILNIFNSLPGPVQQGALAITALGVAVTAGAFAFGLLKAVGVGAIFSATIAGATQAATAMTALAGVMVGKVVTAFTAATAKTLALNAAMKGVSVTALAGQLKGALVVALKGVATASLSAGGSLVAFGVKAVQGLTAATGAALKFMTAIAPLGLAAAAVGSLAAVFQTWVAVGQEASEINKGISQTTQEMTSEIEGLEAVQQTANQSWETSKERVGQFQASLDILRGSLGLTTAEEAELNLATIAVGESMGQFDGQVAKATAELKGYAEELATLTPGTEEYNAVAQKYAKIEEEISKAIEKNIQFLIKQKDGLEGKISANGRVSEAEKRMLATINSAIKGLEAQKITLGAVESSAIDAAGGVDQFSVAVQTNEEKIAASKTALDQYKKGFQQIIAEMEIAFKKSQDADKRKLEADLEPLRKELNALKALEAARDRAFQKRKRQAEEAARIETQAASQRMEAARAAADAEIQGLEESLSLSKEAGAAQIATLKKIEAARVASFQKSQAASAKYYESQIAAIDREIAKIREANTARQAGIAKQIASLQKLTPAEKELAQLEKDRLKAQVELGGEEGLRAQAQLDQINRSEKIARLQEKAAKEQEKATKKQEKLEEQKQQKEKKFLEDKAQAEASNAAAAAAAAQEIGQLKEELAAKEKATLEEIDQKKRTADEQEKAREEQAKADKEARYQAEKAAEDEAQTQKEENLEKISDKEDEIAKVQAEALEKRVADEESFARTRESLLDKYKAKIENVNKDIATSGRTTWRSYANSAIQQINRIIDKQKTLNRLTGGQGIAGASGLPFFYEGGQIRKGQLTHINELGQESFLGESGRLTKIKKSAMGVWRAPENGTVIPAHITSQLDIPDRGINVNTPPENNVISSHLISKIEPPKHGEGFGLLRENTESITDRITEKWGATDVSKATSDKSQIIDRTKESASTVQSYILERMGVPSTNTSSESRSLEEKRVLETVNPVTIQMPSAGKGVAQAQAAGGATVQNVSATSSRILNTTEAGAIIPAHITAKMAIPERVVNISQAPVAAESAARKAAGATSGGTAQLIRAIASMKNGDRITNNVSIQSAQPVQDASDMMVEMTKLKRRRFG